MSHSPPPPEHQSSEHHGHPRVDAASSLIAHLFSRLIRALDDWRERAQLRDELDELERTGQLDSVLGEVGLTRGQIPALLEGRPGAAQRMERMMKQEGIDRAELHAAGEQRDAEWRCQRCESTDECEAWLSGAHPAGVMPSFCPNKPVFEEVHAKKT